jgi:O-antigen biosynthesis protein
MKTCYTVIIGAYDDLKQPAFVSQHWKYICFTDQDLELPPDNVWEIVKIVPDPNLSNAKNARRIKILFYEYIKTEFSLFIDATFYINCDLNRWWRRFQLPMTCVSHPFDDCIYTDVRSCMGGKKGDFFTLVRQTNDYRNIGIEEHKGLIASGILMRQNTKEVRDICETWWSQVEEYTERDQIAFGYAAFKHPGIFHTIRWNYQDPNIKEFLHVPHLHKLWRSVTEKHVLAKMKRR